MSKEVNTRTKRPKDWDQIDREAAARRPKPAKNAKTPAQDLSIDLRFNAKGWHSLSPDERIDFETATFSLFISGLSAWAAGSLPSIVVFYFMFFLLTRKYAEKKQYAAAQYHERMFNSLPGQPETGLYKFVSGISALIVGGLFLLFIGAVLVGMLSGK